VPLTTGVLDPMKKLIIGFSDGGNMLSALIKYTTKSLASHTFIMLPEENNLVYQASGRAVNYENYKHFLSHEKVIELYELELTDEEYTRLRDFRNSKVGDPYASRELVGFLWVLACRQILDMAVRNPLSMGDHAYICVDIVTSHLSIGNTEGTKTPEDLRRWCEKSLKRA